MDITQNIVIHIINITVNPYKALGDKISYFKKEFDYFQSFGLTLSFKKNIEWGETSKVPHTLYTFYVSQRVGEPNKF